MTEEQFTSAVIEYAMLRKWLVFHPRPARTGKGWRTPTQGHVGYPDLTMARDGVVIHAELKSEKGRVRPEQKVWLEALGGVVWRPSDWPTIEEVLA